MGVNSSSTSVQSPDGRYTDSSLQGSDTRSNSHRDRNYRTILDNDRSNMHSMRTHISTERSWFHREYSSRVSTDHDQIRQSWSEQTQLLSNPVEDSDVVTDSNSITFSTSSSNATSTSFIEKQDQTQFMTVESFPAVSGGSFSPDKLVGCEIEIPDVGYGTVTHYLYEENESYHYLFQMRDGRKVVVPISIATVNSDDFRIQGKIVGRLF